ncbi:MAG: DNA-processing protein DprA [Thiomargarita sp.]|nr:DNA-processing protein DprA [Thiomargarita sp.]
MTDEAYWLALIYIPGIGPASFIRLINYFGNPRQVFAAGEAGWQEFGLKDNLQNALKKPNWQAVEKNLQWSEKPNRHLLTLESENYPSRLREIDNPPPILFVHGDVTLLTSKQLAIVGTRNPSQEGLYNATYFAEQLSHEGLTITSGMAYGIDGASHKGALAASGRTIAVAGTGLDRVYPPQHRDLAHQIAEQGAIISEFTLGTAVHRGNFPARNRIVSGLCLGTLVIEAPEKSGSLYTAQHAIKQGREIFAIPGSIHNPLIKGCHKLIRQGAKLVETVDDIIEELGSHYPFNAFNGSQSATIKSAINKPIISNLEQKINRKNNPTLITKINYPSDLDEEHINVLNYLQTTPSSVDNLVEQFGLTAAKVSSILLILEIKDLIALQPGGSYIANKNSGNN